jgi:hypothetical protein
LVTCTTPTVAVTWDDPPIPEIRLFLAAPSTVVQGAGTIVGLTWIVQKAAFGKIRIDRGVGFVDAVGAFFGPSPDDDTTFTLTAEGRRPEDTRTATAKVKVLKAPTLTLTAPANNSEVTGAFPSVPVAGTVENATPGLSVQVTVNAALAATLPVVNGSFSGSVPLSKTILVSDLSLNNPSVSVLSQGAANVPVTLSNGKSSADVTNVITASLVGGPAPSVQSATVYHTVQVDRFVVDWLNCPPFNKDESVNQPLGAGQTIQVGTVSCGVTSGGFCATCSVRASVSTSAGSLASVATWVFNVPPCQDTGPAGE